MGKITLDYSRTFISDEEIESLVPFARTAHDMLHKGYGAGSDFTGWLQLPQKIRKEEVERIKKAAVDIKESSDALVVIGVGGSYLGSRACIEALNHNFYNQLPIDKRRGTEIYFVGNNLSSSYISDLMDILRIKISD